ncbi:MAG: HD domain-containing protein [Candidatus Competibacterales bacterium]
MFPVGELPIDDPVTAALDLLAKAGDAAYDGEAVTQKEHALQAATLALDAGAKAALIGAALLHDIGHLLARDHNHAEGNDRHEELGYRWLARHFVPALAEPVGLHVAAKRYLCSVEPSYYQTLSAASKRSLERQGGVMTAAEAKAFVAHPHGKGALQLRRWDEAAKVVGGKTPGLEYFRGYLTTAVVDGGLNTR